MRRRAGPGARTRGAVNVAAASAGATASASTTYAGYSPAGAINGDRKGATGARAAAGTTPRPGSFPDWLQVDFAGPRTISEVRLFSVQDNYTNPVEPTTTQTFSLYGVTSFTVQYWDGAQWLTVPGGTITGNRTSGARSRSRPSPPPVSGRGHRRQRQLQPPRRGRSLLNW